MAVATVDGCMSTMPVTFDFLGVDVVSLLVGVGVVRCLGVVLVRPVAEGRFVAAVPVLLVGEMMAMVATSRIAAVSGLGGTARERDCSRCQPKTRSSAVHRNAVWCERRIEGKRHRRIRHWIEFVACVRLCTGQVVFGLRRPLLQQPY